MSTRNINDFPNEILLNILRRAFLPKRNYSVGPPDLTLTNFVQQAGFICRRWTDVLSNIITNEWKGNGFFYSKFRNMNLKLFRGDYQLMQVYKRLVLNDARLVELLGDERLEFKWEYRNNYEWTRQDHLILQNSSVASFQGLSPQALAQGLTVLFRQPALSPVTDLVVGTFWNKLDLVQLLKGFPKVISLTLLELPNSTELQKEFWKYLATKETPLQQLHIFHRNRPFSLDPEQVAPAFRLLQLLTLHQYTDHPNRSNKVKLLNTLSGNAIRQIRVQNHSRVQKEKHSRWEQRWWEVPGQEYSDNTYYDELSPAAKYGWRRDEVNFMQKADAFRRHWMVRPLLEMLETATEGENILNDFEKIENGEWINKAIEKEPLKDALWRRRGPPFLAVPARFSSEDDFLANVGLLLVVIKSVPRLAVISTATLSLENPGLVNQPPENLGPFNQPPENHGLVNQPPMNPGPVNQPPENPEPVNEPPENPGLVNQPPMNPGPVNQSLEISITIRTPSPSIEYDIEDLPPFILTYVHVVYVTLWLKKMACLVGFGVAAETTFAPEADYLNLLFPRSPFDPNLAEEVVDSHRKLQQLTHLWRALIRELDQRVALWIAEEKGSNEKKWRPLITKSELLGFFLDLYHQFYTGQWTPPLKFFYHSPTDNRVDPLQPWIVIWTLIHDYFKLSDNSRNYNQINPDEHALEDNHNRQISINEINNFAKRLNYEISSNDRIQSVFSKRKTSSSFEKKFIR